jgi:hypothetical protein
VWLYGSCDGNIRILPASGFKEKVIFPSLMGSSSAPWAANSFGFSKMVF